LTDHFAKIRDWKLLSGSHEFPGADGGTCINEAAIVAAGFEYRAIARASDCPPCFSVPCSAYAITLNDAMDDDVRQELLMPFVLRLAGSADPEVERERLEFIAVQNVRRTFPLVYRYMSKTFSDAAQLEAIARRAEDVKTFEEACEIAAAGSRAGAWAGAWAGAGAGAGAWAGAWAGAPRALKLQIWRECAAILDEALKIGRQADTLDLDLVVERLERARAGRPALALQRS